jgi:hypothetical protein
MLLTLGDSFSDTRYVGDKPWPEHLAEKMDLLLLNISHSGESNSFMHRNLIWACEKHKGEFTHVVISLTNWNRYELPLRDYHGLGCKTKTFKPSGVLDVGTDDPFWKHVYTKYYNEKFYIDEAAALMITAQNLKELYGFDLAFMQPILPFKERDKYKPSPLYRAQSVYNYIEKESMLKYVDRELFIEYELSADNILNPGYTEDPQLWEQFTMLNSQNCMGYHDLCTDKRYMDVFDAHPNQRGHKLICDKIFKRFNNDNRNS